MNVERVDDRTTLVIDSTEVSLPYPCSLYQVVGDVVVCLLATDSRAPNEPDFELPSPTRSFVGILEMGERAWTIDPYPDPTDPRHYVRVYRFHDRCVCKRWAPKSAENWVEIDPGTGAVVETFPLDTLRVDGEPRRFPRNIASFYMFDGIAFVIEDSDRGIYGRYVTAFDESEHELWGRQFESGWLMEKEGKLLSMHEPRMGANTDIEHDPTTGEPVAIHSSVFDTRDDLENYLPRSLYGLIDDYLRLRDSEGS